MKTLDFIKGNTYHIFNGFTESKEDLWFINSKLIDIDGQWDEPKILTFELENGQTIEIDKDSCLNYNKQVIAELENKWAKAGFSATSRRYFFINKTN